MTDDQAKLPAGGETKPPLDDAVCNPTAGTAACPAATRFLPKGADIIIFLSPSRLDKSDLFKLFFGKEVEKAFGEVEDVAALPWKNPLADIDGIAAACVLKKAEKEKAIQKVGVEGPAKPTRSKDLRDWNPFKECDLYGIVIDGKLDTAFSLKDFLSKVGEKAELEVAEDGGQSGFFRITAKSGGDGPELLVGIAGGKIILGNGGFVEAASKASAGADDCPLKELWGSVPDAAIKVAVDVEPILGLDAAEISKVFEVEPEVHWLVGAADFVDKVVVAAKLFTHKNLADPFGEFLFRLNYGEFKDDVIKRMVEEWKMEKSRMGESSRPLRPSLEGIDSCKKRFDLASAEIKKKFMLCEEGEPACEEEQTAAVENAKSGYDDCVASIPLKKDLLKKELLDLKK